MDKDKLEAIKFHWDIMEQLVEKVYQSGLVGSIDMSKQLNQSVDFIKDVLFKDCPDCEKK